jgi:flavin reductase (DIM6/NTAB) family NADH-FMN oxidoreductase RutF
MNFKDAMSLIGNTVSLLSIRNIDEQVHACTISSLVSVSVIPEDEMILFVLKKNSKIGAFIQEIGNFSICVLNAGQIAYASEYSGDRVEEFVSQYKWAPFGDEFVKLNDCRIFFACTFEKIIRDFPSDIYIARVISQEYKRDGSCLIYENRNFGSVISVC